MQIDTRSMPLKAVRGTNDTTSSITEPVPTKSMPSGDGVIAMGEYVGEMCANGVKLIPFGTGSSTQTYTMKVYAWDIVPGNTRNFDTAPLYVPTLLASFTVTLGTAAGVAGTEVNASQLFATNIVLVTGNANISNEIIAPTGNVLAHIVLDAKGASYLEIRTAVVSATDANCLYKTL